MWEVRRVERCQIPIPIRPTIFNMHHPQLCSTKASEYWNALAGVVSVWDMVRVARQVLKNQDLKLNQIYYLDKFILSPIIEVNIRN